MQHAPGWDLIHPALCFAGKKRSLRQAAMFSLSIQFLLRDLCYLDAKDNYDS